MIISKTTIQCNDNMITVSRLIKYKLQTITFNHDVLACDICEYFNMSDEDFIKLNR